MKAQWKETKYGGETLDLGIVSIAVFWDSMVSRGTPTGYKYRFGQYQSNRFYASMDEAKDAAIASVHKRLTDALNLLS